MSIPLMRNTFINERETRDALAKFIVGAPKLSMGDECLAFEREFAQYQGRRHAVLFNSGASANLALLQACKNLGYLSDNDAIGFSALTWATNVMPIFQLGMEAVPIDCDRETLNSMSQHLLDRLKEIDLKAFFITNALGFTGDLEKIREICNQRKILLVEDNCESLGTDLPAGKAGNFGLGSTFSFFVAHHMSTIEGGMACTDDDDFAEMLMIVRANGWDRNLSAAQQNKWRSQYDIPNEFYSKYAFYDLAYNLRPTEITGFLGRCQLQYLEMNIARRNEIFLKLEAVIARNPDLVLLNRNHIKRLSSFGIPILCRSASLRDEYMQKFADRGVEIRPMIAGNIQRQPFYLKYGSGVFDLPGAEALHNCGFYCGNYPELEDSEVAVLAECLSRSSGRTNVFVESVLPR